LFPLLHTYYSLIVQVLGTGASLKSAAKRSANLARAVLNSQQTLNLPGVERIMPSDIAPDMQLAKMSGCRSVSIGNLTVLLFDVFQSILWRTKLCIKRFINRLLT
jgi:hypothetical protein